MIIKLPVCVDEKIIFINFLLERVDNKYILSVFNRNYDKNYVKMKVPLCNNYEGISYLDLFFPLEFTIIDNKLFFNNFMQKIFLSQNNLHIDFFYQLENMLTDIKFLTLI